MIGKNSHTAALFLPGVRDANHSSRGKFSRRLPQSPGLVLPTNWSLPSCGPTTSTAQQWRKVEVLRSDLFEDRKIFVNRRWLDGYASSVISRKAVAFTKTHAGFQRSRILHGDQHGACIMSP
jgi:hypothetical protein